MANINIPAMTETTSLTPATDWVECTLAGVNKKISPNNLVKDTVTVAASTTHTSSDGSDHTFLDQSVVSGGTPTFTGTNFTGIPTAGLSNDAVTYAKIQNVVADDRILGNIGGAGGIVAELTPAQVKTLVALEGSMGIVIDGSGSAITTGIKGWLRAPYACTITAVEVTADVSGSIVIDIWNDTYANFPPSNTESITASAPPTLTTAQKSQDVTLTGWDPTVAEGDYLAFNVDSAATVTLITLTLKVTRT